MSGGGLLNVHLRKLATDKLLRHAPYLVDLKENITIENIVESSII
jgi:hypothetical protein